jgi:hypothetical protein
MHERPPWGGGLSLGRFLKTLEDGRGVHVRRNSTAFYSLVLRLSSAVARATAEGVTLLADCIVRMVVVRPVLIAFTALADVVRLREIRAL